MDTQEDKIEAIDQATITLRTEFMQAQSKNAHSLTMLNKILIQQEQSIRDTDLALTTLTGLVSAQGRDLKRLKHRLDDIEQRFTALEEKLEQRLTTIEGKQ